MLKCHSYLCVLVPVFFFRFFSSLSLRLVPQREAGDV